MVDQPQPQSDVQPCIHCPNPTECGCPETPPVCRTGTCACQPSCPCWWQDYPGCLPDWFKKKKKKKKKTEEEEKKEDERKKRKRPEDEPEPKRRRSVTTQSAVLRRPGYLPTLLVAILLGIIGFVFLLNRGGEPAAVTPAVASTAPSPTTTTSTVPTPQSTVVAATSTTSPAPPVITVASGFETILTLLGIPTGSIPQRYGAMMPVDPVLHQSGPNLIGPDDHLMIDRYTHLEVTLAEGRATDLRSHVMGDPEAGDYLVFIGETRSAVPGGRTLYQFGLIVSATNELLAPIAGEIGPLGRIPGALLAWFLGQGEDSFTLSGFGLPDFVPLVSHAFGYVEGSIFVFGVPVGELPAEYTAYLEAFGRASEGAPATDDPAGYVITDGYPHG